MRTFIYLRIYICQYKFKLEFRYILIYTHNIFQKTQHIQVAAELEISNEDFANFKNENIKMKNSEVIKDETVDKEEIDIWDGGEGSFQQSV